MRKEMKSLIGILMVLFYCGLAYAEVPTVTLPSKTEKVTPVKEDIALIGDSAASMALKKTQLGSLPISNPTQTVLDTKAPLVSPAFPNGFTVVQSAIGPQMVQLKAKSPATGYTGWAASPNTANQLILLPPTTDPTATETVLAFGPKYLQTFPDGVTRYASQATWAAPGTGIGATTFMALTDKPANVDTTDLSNIGNSRSDLQAQIDAITAGSITLDAVPNYYNSPHNIGIAVGGGKAYFFDSDDSKWKYMTLTNDMSASPTNPALLSAAISGLDTQILTFSYGEAMTANTTAELCSLYVVEMTNAGFLSLTTISGNGSSVTTCAITEPVYSDDTLVGASYDDTLIRAVDDAAPLLPIPSISVANNSTKEPVGCGTSTVSVSDTFDGTLDGFTVASGPWAIDSGLTYPTTTSTTVYKHLLSTTLVDPACQWVDTGLTSASGLLTGSGGVILRASGATGLKYYIRYRMPTDTITWDVLDGDAMIETVQTVNVTQPSNGVRMVAQAIGTGYDTEIHVWIDPVGTGPSDFGAATYVLTDNPTNAVDTGSYSGIGTVYFEGSVNKHTHFVTGN